MPPPDEIYREEIGFFWGRLAVAIMWLIAVALFIMLGIQRSYGPMGDNPAPDLVLVIMGVYFVIIGWVLLNFATFIVSATPAGVTAGYGSFRYHVAWKNVAGYESGLRRAFPFYAGYGIHVTCKKGRPMLVYNVMAAPNVVLELKNGRFGYFAFSTRRPMR